MWRIRVSAGSLFLIAGALASSVLGHRLVDVVGKTGVLESATYGTYRHLAIVPAFVAAVVAASLAGLALVRERGRSMPFGRSDGLVREALAVVAMNPVVVASVLAALQLGLLYLMESAEHLLAFGTLPGGLSWLGGDPRITLCIHLALVVATALALRHGGRSLVAACDRLISLVDAIVASKRRLLERGEVLRVVVRRRRTSLHAPRTLRRIGLRAPPTAT